VGLAQLLACRAAARGGIQYVEHTEGDGAESGPRAWLSKFIAVMQIKHLV
jgi:hypothetical protein